MAELGVLKDARIWMGAYEITASMNAVSLRHAVDVKDNTVFGLNTRSEAAGLRMVEARASGLYAVDGTDEIDDVLSANLAVADTPISFGVETGALGEVGYTFESLQTVYEWGAPVGDLPGYDMTAGARGTPLVRGTILHVGAETATDTETGSQIGAVSATQRAYAALHVTAVSGTSPTLDLIVQSDDNAGFTSATNRITFTQATAITSEWLSVAGAITDDYWRASWTIGGSDTPTFTFALVVGIF
jgi:hypothetical protein